MRNRKSYSPEFKTQVVLEVLREEKSMAQVASENEVHPNLIAQWKAQFLKGCPDVFRDGRKSATEKEMAHEKKYEELYSEIGKLTTQLNWLKKKAGGKFEQI